jgi:PAS domain-containing protein
MRFAQEAGKIGAFEWNLKSDVIVWTPELENIYDLRSGEFNKTFDDWMKWIHPSDVVDLRNEIRKVLEGQCELNYQFRIITNSDELRWILARGKVLRDGEGERVKLI